jgi:uncharacterized protein YkwD
VGWGRGRWLIPLVIAAAIIPAAPAAAKCTRSYIIFRHCDQPSPSPTPEPAPKVSADPAAQLLDLINEERSSRGLQLLRPSSMLQNVAQGHAERMREKYKLYHNEWLFTDEAQRKLHYPQLLDENVGVEQSIKQVHQAFMDSEPHRKKLLRAAFDRIGLGVAYANRSYWVVEDFGTWRKSTSASSSSSSSSSSSTGKAGSAPVAFTKTSASADRPSPPGSPSRSRHARWPETALLWFAALALAAGAVKLPRGRRPVRN